MSKFTSFLLGGIMGAGIALLFAPQSGDKTRALVTERANALANEAKGFTANMPDNIQDAYRTAVDQGTSFVNNAVEKGTNLVNEASARVKEATGQAADAADSDELRDKIEAARQRIASQVMENAEQSKAVTEKATEAAVSAVESAGKKVEDAADAVSKSASEVSNGK